MNKRYRITCKCGNKAVGIADSFDQVMRINEWSYEDGSYVCLNCKSKKKSKKEIIFPKMTQPTPIEPNEEN
jgi:predicted SprT family Zn-dependent metalloprotease